MVTRRGSFTIERFFDQFLAHEGRDPSSMRHTIQDHMYINLDGSETEIRAKVRRFTYKPFEEIAPYIFSEPRK